MRNIKIILVLFLGSLIYSCSPKVSSSSSSSDGIQFQNVSIVEAKKIAEKEGKLLFVDAHAVWCGPCKMLSKKTFPDKDLGAYFNENFVNVKVDVDQAEGREFASKYSISSIPVLLFLKPNGEIVKQEIGFLDAKQLLKVAKGIKS